MGFPKHWNEKMRHDFINCEHVIKVQNLETNDGYKVARYRCEKCGAVVLFPHDGSKSLPNGISLFNKMRLEYLKDDY